MPDIVSKVSGPFEFAALAILIFGLVIRIILRKVQPLNTAQSGFISVLLPFFFLTVLLLGFAYSYFIDVLKLTGASFLDYIKHDPIAKEGKLTQNKTFNQTAALPEQFLPKKRSAYFNSPDIAEDEPFYDSQVGLEFTVREIDPDRGTAQLGIGSDKTSADSLVALKGSGIAYRNRGKTYTIHLVNTHQVDNKKYATLLIQQCDDYLLSY